MAMNGIPRGDLDWRPADPARWQGRYALVVGGTAGIGRAIARKLASLSTLVTVVGRTFRDEGHPGITFVQADLSSMKAAERTGAALPAEQFELAVFTTGIMTSPERVETSEGIEQDMAISYLSRFVLLRQIAPRLGSASEAQARPRTFIMGFPGTGEVGNVDDPNSERSYKPFPAHMNTVAGNEALVLDSVQRYPHVDTFGLNPGLIKTDIRGNMLGGQGSLKHRLVEGVIGVLTPSPEQYAKRIVPLLGSPDLEGRSGAMFNKKGVAIRRSEPFDEAFVSRWIQASEALLERATR